MFNEVKISHTALDGLAITAFAQAVEPEELGALVSKVREAATVCPVTETTATDPQASRPVIAQVEIDFDSDSLAHRLARAFDAAEKEAYRLYNESPEGQRAQQQLNALNELAQYQGILLASLKDFATLLRDGDN